MIYDLIIVGGGAAGLTCANLAKRKGLSFILLEAANRTGKKLLATGNGKCNLTNIDIDATYYNTDFVKPLIAKYSYQEIISFFAALGMKTKQLENRIYPYTESSATVLNFLLKNIKENIVCDYKVNSIDKSEDFFLINDDYKSKNIIIATGSNATIGYNSLELIEKFGHRNKAFVASLVPLTSDLSYIKGLSGLRVKARATLFDKDNFIAEQKGEVLFKDNGISGIAVFMLSAYMARQKGHYRIILDFAEDISEKEIGKYALEGIVRDNLARNVIKQANDKKQSVEYTLKNFEITGVSLGSIKNSQVCSGGLLTDNFDANTLESKTFKGLYAVGEVLDVDGQCGGFNLHWAWSSAMAVMSSL